MKVYRSDKGHIAGGDDPERPRTRSRPEASHDPGMPRLPRRRRRHLPLQQVPLAGVFRRMRILGRPLRGVRDIPEVRRIVPSEGLPEAVSVVRERPGAPGVAVEEERRSQVAPVQPAPVSSRGSAKGHRGLRSGSSTLLIL